ncbi:MAG: tetratricopeptide repeat protein [Deltaproteobacteria bacterium]|nr:tetratricopeptide repeat protein [Deltaproteobacteria bacterium]
MGKASRRKQDQIPSAPGAAPTAAAPRRPPRARAGGAPSWLVWLAGPAVIVGLGIALYANSFAIPFLFDDHFEITNNPAVKTLGPLASYLGRSRGLTLYSFALNADAGGMQVWGFHAVNVALHVANALLVYLLVLRTMTLPVFGGRYARQLPLLAGLTGVVFVAHPLQTMAASYLVQRAESLAAFWYLLAMLAVGGALASDGGRRLGLIGAALLAAALGVASKEVAATLPAAALVYVLCFGAARGIGRRGRWMLPLALLPPLLYALWLALPYLWPANTDPFNPSATRSWIFVPSAGFQTAGIDAWHYLLTQFGVITHYLRLYLLPVGQCFDYGWPIVDGPWRADVLAPFALLLAIAAAGVASVRRYPLASFCIAWVFITLSPASSVIPLRDAAFEHRMYLPMVGLAWLTVVGGADLLAALAPRLGLAAASAQRGGALLLCAWIVLLGGLTFRRNEVMSDPIALATDSASQAPEHWRPRFELGAALIEQGRTDEAIAALREAVRLGPKQGVPRVQLAGLLIRAGALDEAEQVVRPATDLTEESVVAAAYQQLANIEQARGNRDAAAEALLLASRAKPDWASLHQQRARLLAKDGTWFVAANEYNRAIELKPSLLEKIRREAVEANLRAATVVAGQGRPRGALHLAELALTYDPGNVTARWQLAAAAAALGEWARAEQALLALQAARPNDPAVAAALAQVRAQQVIAMP